MFRPSTEEVHEACTAIEFGEEESGISLGFWVLYPIKTWPDAASVTAALSENSTSIATHLHNSRERERVVVLSKYGSIGEWKWFWDFFFSCWGFCKLGEDPRGGWVFKGERGEITVVASGF